MGAHIVHVIHRLDFRTGGPAVALAGLARAQAEVGLSVSVVASWEAGDDPDTILALEQQGVKVMAVGPQRGRLRGHSELAAAMTRAVSRADLVHIHGLWEPIQHLAARAAWSRGIPYILRPCGMLDPWSLRQSRYKKMLYLAVRMRGHLDRACAVHYTTSLEKQLAAPLGLKSKCIVEPNGVDVREFDHSSERGLLAKCPNLSDRPLVLFMGRLHQKKGFDTFIPAFARLQNKRAMLGIAGPDSGGYRAVIERMIAREGLGDRVFFTGMLNGTDRIGALARADLFVLPSRQENFGIAVVEALAAGTPVVVSEHVNLHPEISAAGVGSVVPDGVNALAREMDDWLSDPERRQAAGLRGIALVQSRFDWRQIASRWADSYPKLIAGSQSASGEASLAGIVGPVNFPVPITSAYEGNVRR